MRFDLKTPCKNCPFRNDATAIRFAHIDRAAEISNSAYRNGFPCHLSADHFEDDEGESSGFIFGDQTQHCAGALMIFARHDDGTLPFQDLPEDEQQRVLARLDWRAPVFEDERDYLESYEHSDLGDGTGHGTVSTLRTPAKPSGMPPTSISKDQTP